MCAITGWASFHHDARTRAPVIEAMTAALIARGPGTGGVRPGERAAGATGARLSSAWTAASSR